MLSTQSLGITDEFFPFAHRWIARVANPGHDLRDGCRRFAMVDGDADQLGASLGQLDDLLGRPYRIGRIGVGHGLNRDGVATADANPSDRDRHC